VKGDRKYSLYCIKTITPLPSPVTPKQRYPEPQTTGQSDHQHLLLPKTTPTATVLIRRLSFWLGSLFKNLKHCYLFFYYSHTHRHILAFMEYGDSP